MSENEQCPKCKVVLLGESGVGKTCIISRYISGSFDDKSESTNGASYASKVNDYPKLGKYLRLDIWDTAGQERYRSLTKFFYKDAAIAILVYDITRRESYEELKNYWYNQLKTSINSNISKNYFFNFFILFLVIGIAGNKCDKYDQEQISEEEVRKYANEINAIFRLTSAFDNTGIDDLFKSVGNLYLDPNYQDIIEKDKIEKDTNKGPTITLDQKTVTETDKKIKKKKGNCC